MRNEIIVQKLLAYANKLVRYCDGLDYEGFSLIQSWSRPVSST